MAALTRPRQVQVRAALAGEGRAIAALWRELWDAHEGWGGYPGSRDPRVYAQLAQRLDEDARVRAGHPVLGRHVHLVADLRGVPCGQVEGWFERHGVDVATAFTCEVRSLIVAERARGLGAGRALLDALAAAARSLARDVPCVLAAEVLEPNPAQSFYTRIGYIPVAYSARIDASPGLRVRGPMASARLAVPGDALAIVHLEGSLAARRHAGGDRRFDRPRAVDSSLVTAMAAHLGRSVPASPFDPTPLVALDASGTVRASASFTVHALEPPFLPRRRALIGRYAVDPTCAAAPFAAALTAAGCDLARSHGAPQVEITDLPPPGSELWEAARAAGARPWSRVVTKLA